MVWFIPFATIHIRGPRPRFLCATAQDLVLHDEGGEDDPKLAFTSIGLAPVEETAYRTLLRRSHGSAAEVARLLGTSAVRARAALEALEVKGFVSRMLDRSMRFVATPPEVAVEVAIYRQLESIERVRHSAQRLAEDSRVPGASAPIEVVEVVLGGEAVLQRWAQLQQIATGDRVAGDAAPHPKIRGCGAVHRRVAALMRHLRQPRG